MVVGRDAEHFADMTSELRVRQALTRRSLALDQVALLNFDESERYHDFLFSLTTMDVPSTHVRVSLTQVLLADKQIWAIMAQHCRAGISTKPNGLQPMSAALEEARRHPIVMAMLQPLPSGKGKGPKGSKGSKDGQFMKREWPEDLKAFNTTTKKGIPLCPDYNQPNGCQHAGPGRYCKVGLHVCCKCLQTHSATTCKK